MLIFSFSKHLFVNSSIVLCLIRVHNIKEKYFYIYLYCYVVGCWLMVMDFIRKIYLMDGRIER